LAPRWPAPTRNRCSRPGSIPTLLTGGSGTHSDAHFVLLELMRMLWLASHAEYTS
jgi:hypothetical protein